MSSGTDIQLELASRIEKLQQENAALKEHAQKQTAVYNEVYKKLSAVLKQNTKLREMVKYLSTPKRMR